MPEPFAKSEVPEPSGMFDGVLSSLLSRYGITQELIDKVKTILDKLEISDTEIKIKLK